MSNKPSSALITLPAIPAVPKACLQPLPEEPSESSFTGELADANNVEEKEVGEEEKEGEKGVQEETQSNSLI